MSSRNVQIFSIQPQEESDTHAIVVRLILIAEELRNLSHGANADNGLDREVRLVLEVAREVVRAELVARNERVLDEVLRPLVEEGGLER